MNKSLYEEAIADAKQLRELAEDTAKNRVIDAVMPQIRDLVNRRILGEQLEDEVVTMELIDEPPSVENEIEVEEDAPSALFNVNAQGDVNISVDSEEYEEEEEILTDTIAEA